jgi:dipeptidyl aminopeptidase/acylaminoacyl peptidase
VTLERLTYRRGNVTGARFAPDGQTIFYSAAWEGQPAEVFSTLPGAMQGRALGFLGWDVAALSPQGELALSRRPPNVRAMRFLGTLARVPATGGVPRDVLEDVWSADWSRDGAALAVVREGQPRRIELPVGRVVATSEGHPRMLRVSPDGMAVAFVEIGRSDHSDRIVVADLSGSVRKLAADLDVLGLAWAPDGREVWYSATPGVLAAVNRDGRRRTLAQLAGNLVLHDVARDGRTALVSHVSDRASLVWSPAEGPERDLSWLEGSYVAALGTRHVLFSEWLEGGGRQGSVVLRSLDGAPAVRLGDGDAQDLSPDGRWALARTRSPRRDHVLLPTGLGTARVLPHHDLVSTAEPAQWAPDGQHILFSAVLASGGPPTSFVQSVDDGGIRPLTPRGVTVSGPVSPRGLVYSPAQHALYPLAGGEPRPLPRRPPGALEVVGWSEDGGVAYVLETNVPVPACVMTVDLATGRTALHREFAPRDLAGITRVYPLKLGPDRRSWAYSAYRMLSDLYLLRLP